MGRNKQFPMMSPADKAWITRQQKQHNEAQHNEVPRGTDLTAAEKAWVTRRGGRTPKKPWEDSGRFPKVQWYVAVDSKGTELCFSAAESPEQAKQLLGKRYPDAKVVPVEGIPKHLR
jgi:hypothetical protein